MYIGDRIWGECPSSIHYPMRVCAARVKQCRRICVCVCVGIKILKNTSSRVARAFKDVILKKNKNNQQNHIGTFLYLTQVKAVLFAVIPATSYYRFLGSTPFKIARGIYSQQLNYAHAKIQANAETIWPRVHNKEVREVSIP